MSCGIIYFAGTIRAGYLWNMLKDEQASPDQIAAFRRMPPERRLALAEKLYWSAREWKAAWLHAQHPDWSAEEVRAEVTRIFSNART